MVRWWWPQSSTRLSRAVMPPWVQWRMWWAWHITGGRVQPGNAQWWSRATRAVQIAGVTEALGAADVEDAAVGVEQDADQVAVTRQPAGSPNRAGRDRRR